MPEGCCDSFREGIELEFFQYAEKFNQWDLVIPLPDRYQLHENEYFTLNFCPFCGKDLRGKTED